jgi:hypothetical protein
MVGRRKHSRSVVPVRLISLSEHSSGFETDFLEA